MNETKKWQLGCVGFFFMCFLIFILAGVILGDIEYRNRIPESYTITLINPEGKRVKTYNVLSKKPIMLYNEWNGKTLIWNNDGITDSWEQEIYAPQGWLLTVEKNEN